MSSLLCLSRFMPLSCAFLITLTSFSMLHSPVLRSFFPPSILMSPTSVFASV
ncbi:unnamed protein product [Tuber melanosporum]|uniref:(Perigord truffle) hypothetical protein n=1 Tax=Tuber melanosporum (strain Mel28) TaxID=656061 RepID=D5GEG6_TUBMM|nr:uncharacterized protein GSTUM_00006476001 [Tuber melanosporum]CAZ82909.1 unnamed protein product [Tuber melanosporum]